MKCICLVFTTLLVSFVVCNAQKINLTTSEEANDPKDGSFQLIDADSSFIYAFRSKEWGYGKIFHLETFSRESLKKLSSIKIPFPEVDSAKFNLEDLFLRGDTFRIFYSYFSKKEKLEKLELIDFDRSGNKIGVTKTIDSSSGKNDRKAGNFSIIDLYTQKKFLSYNSKYANDTLRIDIDHFNYNVEKIKTQTFYMGKDIEGIYHSKIDSEGMLYYIVKAIRSKREKYWAIKIFNPDSNTPVTVNLTHKELNRFKISNFFRTFTDSLDNLNFFTTYSEDNNHYSPEGIYWIKFNKKSMQVISEHFIPFYNNDKRKMYGNGYNKMSNAIMLSFLPISDNSLRMIFESRLQIKSTYYGATVSVQYKINDIQIYTIDTGSTIGYCKIPKAQVVNSDKVKYTGYISFLKSDTSIFIYNELPSNLDISEGAKIKKLRNTRVDDTSIIYTLTDQSSILERDILLEKKNETDTDAILPHETLRTSSKEAFTLHEINGQEYLTRISLE